MRHSSCRLLPLAAAFLLAACSDKVVPTETQGSAEARVAHAPGQIAALFASASPEAMAQSRTVFAMVDETAGQMVIGVEDAGAARAVERAMAARGVPVSAYRVELTDPIHFMSTTLRTAHRPTVGGIQIHWSQYLCTLGFNVDHAGGRSFITNSHCTNNQGTTGSTLYYQPTSSAAPTSVAVEVDDPAYTKFAGCSVGKVCRYSDAARALYHNGTHSYRGVIAKTTGENNGSLTTSGAFTVSQQNNSTTQYSGTVHKVGRTTGWTSGNVTNTCVTVNVSGSSVQLHCQTLVQRSGSVIVGGGDSGSPVFRRLSGDNVELVGILWGGSSSGDLFVFSPLKNIQDELGAMTAVSGGGTAPGDGNGGGGGDPDPPPCRPRGKSGNCF